MDKDLFKKKLSEVADWRIPNTVNETSVNAKRKRGRKSNEELYMEAMEQSFLEEHGGINPTVAPMLTKIKHRGENCGDCGRFCENGRQTEAKLHTKGKKSAWRQKCLTCRFYQNPFTGRFELTGSAASIKFNDFMRETKNRYKTKGNDQRRDLIKSTVKTQEPMKTVIENELETITFYHDSASTK